MKNLILASILVTLFLSGCTQNSKYDNAQWRGENRDGIYHETELLKVWPENGPEMLWHFDELGPGHASAAVTNEGVYTCGTIDSTGYVFYFNHSGELQWKAPYGKEWIVSWEGVRVSPLIHQDMIYVMSAYGEIVAMNRSNGEKIWSIDMTKDYDGSNIKWGVTENLVIYNEMLFCTVGGVDANVIAVNKDDGKLIWKNKGNGEKSAYCSPVVINFAGKNMLITQTETKILSINVSNGETVWMHDQPNKYSVHANTALFKDDQLFIVSGYGKGSVMLKLATDGNSVTEMWRDTVLDNRMGGLVLVDDVLYGSGDFSRMWGSLDWNTGKIIKAEKLFKRPGGNTIFADGLIYTYSEAGEVALIDPNNGDWNMISSFKVPYGEKQHWAHLVIHNKRLYVRHGSSMMVYDISK